MGNHCSAIDYIPNLLKKELNPIKKRNLSDNCSFYRAKMFL